MFGDVGLVVNLALDARLRAFVRPCAAQCFLDVTQMVLIAYRHGGTAIAGDNLHGILCAVNGSMAGEQRFADHVVVGGGDIARSIVRLALLVSGLRVVLVFADVAVDVGLVDTVRGNSVFKFLGKENLLTGVFAHLVVVVDKVHGMAVSVSGTTLPVVADIVEEVQSTDGTVLAVHAATHRPVATGAVDKQIMVPRADATVNGCSIAVVSAVAVILVAGDAEGLADDAVLERDVERTTATDGLIGTPGGCAMVNDGVVSSRHTHGITRVLAVDAQAALEADMSADDVRADVDVRCLDADAFARCRLSGNISIGLSEIGVEVKLDDTADVEDDIARLVNIHQSVEQRAFLIDIAAEVGDVVNNAAATTDGISAIALSIGES